MSNEGAQRYCLDCGDEIGNGVRCSDCTVDCRACGATFKTEGSRSNHEHNGHCAACGATLGDRPEDAPTAVSHREEVVHHQNHFVIEDELFLHPITERQMGGGYLCDDCTEDDLELV